MLEKKRKYTLKASHKDTIRHLKRSKEIYQFYLNFLSEKGKVPTLEELGEEFGFSRARAGQILKRLAREGYMLKLDKYQRSYIPNIISGYGKGKGRTIKILK